MNPTDFRRIALSLEGAEEGSHMGAADFRVGGRIFATLAAEAKGYGNLMLTPEIQAEFVAESPAIFLPVAGGWGKSGATHVRLSAANEDLLAGALRTAWRIRKEKNNRTKRISAKKRGKRKVRLGQCIMKERLLQKVEAGWNSASAPLRCIGLRSATAVRGMTDAREAQERIGRLAGEWHFTLRERCSLTRMTFPPRRQLQCAISSISAWTCTRKRW
jgi:YjbR protein